MSGYILLGLLLGLSAFFSGSETALFSLERQQLSVYASSPNPFRRLVARLLAEPRKLLVTVLLGNLLVNVTFYAMASAKALALAREGDVLAGTVVGVLTPIAVIVLGEVTPKTLALGFSGPVSVATAPVLYVMEIVVWPVRVVVTVVTRAFSSLLTARHPRSTYVTPEELKMLITTSESQGVIGPDESIMMQDLVDFGNVLVRDVMVPRVDMVTFQKDAPTEELFRTIRRTGHSSIVVYGSSVDDVVGIIRSREILLEENRPVGELLNRVYFVPETQTVESLLADFRRQRRSFAIVVDEYGGTAGLVTLEDVVETIVGEIHDEYDRPEQSVRDFGDNRYLCPGRLPIADWTEMFGLSVHDRRLTTLGGLVTRLLGHLPREGEQARYGNVLFTVERMRGHGIEEVLVEYVEPSTPSEDAR